MMKMDNEYQEFQEEQKPTQQYGQQYGQQQPRQYPQNINQPNNTQQQQNSNQQYKQGGQSCQQGQPYQPGQQYQPNQPNQPNQPGQQYQQGQPYGGQPYGDQPYQGQYVPQRRMKVKKGGSIGKSILFLFLGIIIAAVGFGIFWFTGLTSIKPDFAMPTNPDSPSVVQAFENFIANAKSGPVKAAFNEDESSYVTSKLFDETTFFNFQDFGGQGIKRLTMTPSEENVRLKMLVELANFSLFKTSSGIKAFYAAPAAGGTVQATLIGIDALLDIRSNGNQLEVKPLKVNIGSSPIPVDTAISMLRQYAPGVMISDDGYISVGPMTIYDRNTGEKLFDISSIKAEEGLLVIETK